MRRLGRAIVVLSAIAAACSTSGGGDAAPREESVSRTSEAPALEGQSSSSPAGVDDRGRAVDGQEPSGVRSAGSLASFEDCDQVLEHIRGEALARVGPDGLWTGQGFLRFRPSGVEGSVAVAGEGEALAEQATAGDSEGPGLTGTNLQVRGVDEPDVFKTDGCRIVSTWYGHVSVVDIGGRGPVPLGALLLRHRMDGDHPPEGELLLHGDRALLIGEHYGWAGPFAGGTVEFGDGPTVIIDEILLHGAPRRGRSLQIEGRYVGSRSIDGTARVVIADHIDGSRFVQAGRNVDESFAAEVNREAVSQSVLEDWLPEYIMISAQDSFREQGQLVQCDRVHAPAEFSGFGSLTVLTIDLNEPLRIADAAAVLGGGEMIHATKDSLYVATTAWSRAPFVDGDSPDDLDDYRTSIHKFALPAGGAVTYEASGSVPGHLLDQFSMHERDGHVFAATTAGAPRSTDPRRTSSIHALRQEGSELVSAGVIGDMGLGERIYAVRYIADRAYVVTYREVDGVDPLYVVDLADPARPALVGELKIPGYSAYLHPIGDNLLVGVGQEADEAGRLAGTKVSVFDVTEPAAPREVDTWTLANAQSDVEWDHRAFLWWEPERLMVLPLRVRDPYHFGGAVVFWVTADGGLHKVGFLTHGGETPIPFTACVEETNSALGGPSTDALCVSTEGENTTIQACDRITLDETWRDYVASGLSIAVEDLVIEIDHPDRIALCWPNTSEPGPMLRSLVAGEELWLHWGYTLQSNDLQTLQFRNLIFPY